MTQKTVRARNWRRSRSRKLRNPKLRPNSEYKKRYSDWHWGLPATKVIEWRDSDFPDHLVQCGRFHEVYFRRPGAKKDTKIRLKESLGEKSHVAFDPKHRAGRLYFLINGVARRALRSRFWKPRAQTVSLRELARTAKGRHARMRDYPNVQVQPLGLLTHVVYRTAKKGDGLSNYIHEFGEESKLKKREGRGILAIDAKGRLWIAGGNYTSPNPGITD